MRINNKSEQTERDRFILAKLQYFTPTEIQALLKKNGFKPVSRARIYQIAEAAKKKKK